MFTILLPELRPYLERLLDDALAQTDMTIRQQATREHMLCLLQKELVRFIFIQLMAALPLGARRQFTSLLDQEAPAPLSPCTRVLDQAHQAEYRNGRTSFTTLKKRGTEHEKTVVSRVGLAVLSCFLARHRAGCTHCGLLHPGISRRRLL